jgi:hypothetical protein
MYHGLLSIIALSAAVLLFIVTFVLAMMLGRAQRRSLAAIPAGPARPEPGPRRLVALVAGEGGGQITSRSGQHPAAGEMGLSPEVAGGLQTICQAAPEVGLHPSNLELLSHLREVTGANDFRFLCGQLANVLSDPDPRYHDLATGLEHGDLTWSQFLAEMRSMPMGALRS